MPSHGQEGRPRFASNTGTRMDGLIPEAYAPFAQRTARLRFIRAAGRGNDRHRMKRTPGELFPGTAARDGSALPTPPQPLCTGGVSIRADRAAACTHRSIAEDPSVETAPGQTVGTVPPSITYSLPCMEAARSEARNATSSATSSGRPGRPIGMPPSESIRL